MFMCTYLLSKCISLYHEKPPHYNNVWLHWSPHIWYDAWEHSWGEALRIPLLHLVDIGMFRFMITCASCSIMMGKNPPAGDIPKCGVVLIHSLVLGSLFWECLHPGTSPHTYCRAWLFGTKPFAAISQTLFDRPLVLIIRCSRAFAVPCERSGNQLHLEKGLMSCVAAYGSSLLCWSTSSPTSV